MAKTNVYTKGQLIQDLALHNDITSKAAADRIVNDIFDLIKEKAVAGNTVQLAGFANLTIKQRSAREATVPGTDKKVQVPAKRVVSIKPAKPFANAVLIGK